MGRILLQLLALMPAQVEPLETRFKQVHPVPQEGVVPATVRPRAVILIHGILVHPINQARVGEALFHDWQIPGSQLVAALGKDADVFAFAYGQNHRVETIAAHPALGNAVAKLKFLGFQEITLLGHSAGGVMARLFVEDHPKAGVTKVVQVCAPNDGSTWARANFGVRKEQEPFLLSLTRKERLKIALLRQDRVIPAEVQCVCVVGVAGTYGDGVVAAASQWPPDLQKQGIPALRCATTHWTVLRSQKHIDKIAELIRDDHPRWTADQVHELRPKILGSP